MTRRLGIDVGGTKCLAVVLGDDGEVVEEHRVPTPHGPGPMVDTLAALAERCRPFDTVGVGVPGLVTRDGVLRAAPNLAEIRDFPVGAQLADRLGGPVEVDNDATCAAVAEWRVGSARGFADCVVVTLGTGIGAGVVAGGRLIRGAHGFTGEVGHMVVDPTGPSCPCGRRGCWERYASGSGLGRLGREAALGGGLRGAMELVGGDLSQLRGEHVQIAARNGDVDAVAVVDEFARWVAIGLVNLANVLDPGLIVLGGGLAASADLFLAPVEHWFAALLYAPELRPHPPVRFASLGEQAGAVGAALLASVR